jgi:decaprenylphospho-beta-D-erythro-pentofuranosid-2-ulose 2-reductase
MGINQKRIVIVGATSLIAEHCARLWAKSIQPNFILLGRDHKKLESISNDLQTRSPESDVEFICLDFTNPEKIHGVVSKIYQTGSVDIALIAHGTLPNQLNCQENLKLNGVSPALFAEAFAQQMEKINYGSLAIIGSVAGDRGRKSNYIYGSAKGLITRYAEGLQHRLAKSNVKVSLIKPGPTETPMTMHLKSRGVKLASVSGVAKTIVEGIAQKKQLIYAPPKWALIMMIIRHLPRFIFNRMDI